MSVVAGSVQEASLFGRSFACDANAEVTITPGTMGSTTKLFGDGTPYFVGSRLPAEVDGLALVIDNTERKAELSGMEFLDFLAASKDFFPVTITLADGRIYQGTRMRIEDRPVYNARLGTATVKLTGGPMELQT